MYIYTYYIHHILYAIEYYMVFLGAIVLHTFGSPSREHRAPIGARSQV